MRRIWSMLGVIMVIFMSGIGDASATTGNEIYSFCASSNSLERFECGMYAIGAYEAIIAVGAAFSIPMICTPDGVTNAQIKDIFIKSLRDHPEKRNLQAADLLWAAMVEAFPCAKKATKKHGNNR